MDSGWQLFSLNKSDCLRQPIETQLSPKYKIFSEFFSVYLKSKSNFEHFEEKDEPHSSCIFEFIECKKRGDLNA